MKKIKITKKHIPILLIVLLSSVLNFSNLGIEGTANSYYAAAVRSMVTSFKNFFFVSFDPAGFVTIDKPPVGYWLQALSAKLFGFSGWSLLLPQALAGVISVILIFHIVRKSFGSMAAHLAALFLAITPVFVADSRNNTVDNILVMVLLIACHYLSIAAEKGKIKYILLSMIFVGIGFNVKMLQAYMLVPTVYITYLLTSAVSLKKRLLHLAAGSVILITVSLSWAIIVDLVPASSRPYVDSSTNNTVMELIIGHNGLERLGLSNTNKDGMRGSRGNAPNGFGQGNNGGFAPRGDQNDSADGTDSDMQRPPQNRGNSFSPNGGGAPMGFGGGSALQGTFGAETPAGFTRLFSRNILSDQIVWFLPLAILGFLAAAFREKLNFKLNNKKKQALMLWFMWFFPEFIYFSFNTGLFHSYYLTMLAPPIAALAGIGISSMWNFYKEGGLKAWILPLSLFINGTIQLMLLAYFKSSSTIVSFAILPVAILCFAASIVLVSLNLTNQNSDARERINEGSSSIIKKSALSLALVGLIITPLIGSAATIFYPVNGSMPAAGLELLTDNSSRGPRMNAGFSPVSADHSGSDLTDFLLNNKTEKQKYLLVVSNSNSASDIIIKTGEAVMSLGGFMGNIQPITLDEYKQLVKNGEVRYVMAEGGMGMSRGGSSPNSEIMNWVTQNGTLVSAEQYTENANSNSENRGGFGRGQFGQLYDLISLTEGSSSN